MQEDLGKYIGLIHKYQGQGKYCDCLNLVQRFYQDHHYKQTFDDGKPRPKTWDEYITKQPPRMIRYLVKNFKKTTVEHQTEEIVRMLSTYGDHPNYPKMDGKFVVDTYTYFAWNAASFSSASGSKSTPSPP